MKKILLFLIFCYPLVSQQIPIDNRVVKGQLPSEIISQKEQQPVDPELLKTIEQYEKLIEQYPENSDLRYNLGNLKYLAGDHEGAIDEYRQNLSTLDEQKKSHALYNIGNSLFGQGKYQESADFYKKALQVNPGDEDMKVNYELTRRMLEQQQQQSQQSDNDKKDDEEKKQEQQEKQQSENQDGEKKDSGEEQEAVENQQEPEKNPGDEESQKEDQQRLKKMSEEKQLAKDEAEAILNALKASQKNLMKKKYVVKNRLKLEKDW